LEHKFSYNNVVSALQEEGIKVSKRAVWLTVKKYREHGTISRLPGSGGSFKLTPEMLRLVEDHLQEDDEATAIQLLKLLNDNGYDVSKTTIIRARKLLGWTFHGSRYCQMIRQANKEKRLTWAQENLDNSFSNVVWTDESMIQLENHRTFSYRKVGAPPKPKQKPKHPYKVMVWAGISRYGATNICLINTSVDSAVYQEILRTHLLPLLSTIANGEFQQDNAPCHKSSSTRRFLESNGVKLMVTPPESPDLNPIENLWHELKYFLRTFVKPQTKEELLSGIQAFWETVTPAKCCRYIDHLQKVIPRVIEVKGEATGY
jgi:transposase/Fe2+ or Zn2+ uptake regulation protein